MGNEPNGTALAVHQPAAALPAPVGVFTSLDSFENAQRMCRALVSSSFVPAAYQGDAAMGNSLVALDMAQRLNANPLMVMQNLHVINGRPSWSSQWVIALLNSCGRFSALRFVMDGTGDEWGCMAWAYDKASGDKLEGPRVTIGLAKAEGWYGKNGSKWKTMPDLMLRYRCAKWFGNLYAPDLLMGIPAADEVEDMVDITPAAAPVAARPANVTEPASAAEAPRVVEGEVLEPGEAGGQKRTRRTKAEMEAARAAQAAAENAAPENTATGVVVDVEEVDEVKPPPAQAPASAQPSQAAQVGPAPGDEAPFDMDPPAGDDDFGFSD